MVMKKIFAIFLCFSLLFSIAAPAFSAYRDDEFLDVENYGLDDEEIYDDVLFYPENEVQLAVKRVPNQLIIKFKDPSAVPGRERLLQKEIDKVKKIGFSKALGVYAVKIDDFEKTPNAILNRLKNNRFIEYVEPNYILDYMFVPNDEYYHIQQPILTMLNAQAGWDITRGENSPLVAIVDTGIASHPDLPVPVKGYSVVSSLSYTNDKRGHGTDVAGILGAAGNNKTGVTGINMNARIMAVKTDDASGSTNVFNISDGITWAADNGAKVISMSIAISNNSDTLKNAIDHAYNMGCALFAATGNAGIGSVFYPAHYDNVMAVGATIDGVTKVNWSNYGPEIDVVGVANSYTTSYAYSATKGDIYGYEYFSGTSSTTPQAAALASLIYSLLPNANSEEVYSLIRQGAKPLGGGYNTQTGYGLIDIGKTLELAEARKNNVTAVPQAPTITVVGSSQIVLHLDSGTPYIEQGATAIDTDGKDITRYVDITGEPDRYTAGTYTITYSVMGKNGVAATATRKVLIIAPESKVTVRTNYSFSEQAKQGTKLTSDGIIAVNSGWLDLKVTDIDKNMKISVQLVNIANKAIVLRDSFSAVGNKRCNINAGTYNLIVIVDKAVGISKYSLNILMPEVAIPEFNLQEVAY
jgi:thermitase